MKCNRREHCPHSAVYRLIIQGSFRGSHCHVHPLKHNVGNRFQHQLILAVCQHFKVHSCQVRNATDDLLVSKIAFYRLNTGRTKTLGADDPRQGLSRIYERISLTACTQRSPFVIGQLANLPKVQLDIGRPFISKVNGLCHRGPGIRQDDRHPHALHAGRPLVL